MELDLNILRPEERVSLQLRLLYEKAGFRQYHMGRFESTDCIRRTGDSCPPNRLSPLLIWTVVCWR